MERKLEIELLINEGYSYNVYNQFANDDDKLKQIVNSLKEYKNSVTEYKKMTYKNYFIYSLTDPNYENEIGELENEEIKQIGSYLFDLDKQFINEIIDEISKNEMIENCEIYKYTIEIDRKKPKEFYYISQINLFTDFLFENYNLTYHEIDRLINLTELLLNNQLINYISKKQKNYNKNKIIFSFKLIAIILIILSTFFFLSSPHI